MFVHERGTSNWSTPRKGHGILVNRKRYLPNYGKNVGSFHRFIQALQLPWLLSIIRVIFNIIIFESSRHLNLSSIICKLVTLKSQYCSHKPFLLFFKSKFWTVLFSTHFTFDFFVKISKNKVTSSGNCACVLYLAGPDDQAVRARVCACVCVCGEGIGTMVHHEIEGSILVFHDKHFCPI